jgi:small subunit ribosomal protein S8
MKHGFLQAIILGTTSGPEPKLFRTSPISERRIWSVLKFRDQKPVLMSCELISKPSRRIFMDDEELKRFVSGKRVRFSRPTGMGEIVLVNTKYGWKEAREAIMDGVGGEVVVRASSL